MLFPNCIGTISLFAVLIFRLKSYFAPISAENPELAIITLFSSNIISDIYAPDDEITMLVSLSSIST